MDSAGYEERIGRFYDLVSSRPLLTATTRYMNMGYWHAGTRTLDDACEAMARFVAEFGEFGQSDAILDAGCGFGDQDVSWARQYPSVTIAAVNISRVQVEAAQRTIHELGLRDRIAVLLASATRLPFADESFDTVVSVESALHFGTREDFFREAFRVLRPGGRIATTDIIPMPGATIPRLALHAVSLNERNMYPRDAYAEKLAAAGFSSTIVYSVRDVVLMPFKQYMSRAAASAPISERVRATLRSLLVPPSKLDYVVARADKDRHVR
jgi:ubiquinone/menaquinone biosynthesis C-methylase UbiE